MKRLALLSLAALALSGCVLTTAPQPVVAGVASFDGNSQTSGLVARAPGGGFIVTWHWTDRYNAMAEQYHRPIVKFPLAPPQWPGCSIATAEQAANFGVYNGWRKSGITN